MNASPLDPILRMHESGSNVDWMHRHLQAWHNPKPQERALKQLIEAWADYATQHFIRYLSHIGEDSFLSRPFIATGNALIDMLNGELGRFDGGTLDALIREIATNAGVDLETEAPLPTTRAEFDGEALVFKHEDDTDGGEPTGPLWIRKGTSRENYMNSPHVNHVSESLSPQWFTLSEAKGFADRHGVPLEEV